MKRSNPFFTLFLQGDGASSSRGSRGPKVGFFFIRMSTSIDLFNLFKSSQLTSSMYNRITPNLQSLRVPFSKRLCSQLPSLETHGLK